MNDLNKLLSRTEKRNSEIIDVREYNLFDVLDKMEKTILTKKDNEEIVRIIVINNSVVKLMSKDNGTPYVYNFDIDYGTWDLIGCVTRYFCREYQLTLSKLSI